MSLQEGHLVWSGRAQAGRRDIYVGKRVEMELGDCLPVGELIKQEKGK